MDVVSRFLVVEAAGGAPFLSVPAFSRIGNPWLMQVAGEKP
jgi:hypothetical protein